MEIQPSGLGILRSKITACRSPVLRGGWGKQMESLTVESHLLSCPVWTSRALQCKECALRKLSLPTSKGLKPDLSIVLGKCSLMPGAPTLRLTFPCSLNSLKLERRDLASYCKHCPKELPIFPRKKNELTSQNNKTIENHKRFHCKQSYLSGTRGEGWAEDWDSSIGGRWAKGAGVVIKHISHGRYWINCFVNPPKEGHLA